MKKALDQHGPVGGKTAPAKTAASDPDDDPNDDDDVDLFGSDDEELKLPLRRSRRRDSPLMPP